MPQDNIFKALIEHTNGSWCSMQKYCKVMHVGNKQSNII